ncbi:MAG: hypothetical protein CMH83_06685 [Nocardioides sp.]|nr:hypothetical protein [Nocardioides sp.]
MSVVRRLTSGAAATAAAAALLLGAPVPTPSASAASPAVAASATSTAPVAERAGLICRARMSNARPKQYSYVTVLVRTGKPRAKVSSVAHYKTTDTRKSGKATKKGRASLTYYISSASAGYRVNVDVTVTSGSQRRTCRTSFVPHS